jgi:ubiquinone/menaquinone biosynthesis C-methylase UbiE
MAMVPGCASLLICLFFLDEHHAGPMSEPSGAHGAPVADPIAYMGQMAASEYGRVFRERALAALDLRPGQVALDVGCGPGANLQDLSDGVTATGRVIAVDLDPAMAREARSRMAGDAAVGVLAGDGHALPLADGCVDRARLDRVLQHVCSPARVLAEIRRVARPGAVVALGEPDWATLAIDSPDLRTSADVTAFLCAHVVRNPSIGRELARLAAGAGFTVRSVHAHAALFGDFTAADQLIGLGRVTTRAVDGGFIDRDRAAHWLAALSESPFLAAVTFFSVAAGLPV